MNLLVDSAKLIDWQRKGKDPRVLLADRVRRREVFLCGVIRVEVIRGIRDSNWRRDLESFFDLVPDVPTDRETWVAATDMAWELDRRGIVLPLTDIVIGVCALRVGAAVVTSDGHFSEIPNLAVLPELPNET